MTDAASNLVQLPVVATTSCPFCGVVVPDCRFCGACGADLSQAAFRGAQRLHSYAAFPDEPVLRLSATTSLFPHLSHRARAPFRSALGVIVALLVVFALAGTAGPLMAVCVLGVPLLFLLYILEVDPYESTFVRPTGIALFLGAGLGAGWALIAHGYVDRTLVPSPSASLTSGHAILAAVGVPTAAQLLMCIPIFVVRFVQREGRESLDGFVAGATSALGFTLAGTVVLLSPWLTNGQFTHQSFLTNLSQAVVRGLTMPLISAMSTGLIGAALWVTTGANTAARGRWIASPMVALVIAEALQIGTAFASLAVLSDADLVVVQLAAIGVLIVLMRVGIHQVLLHEALDVGIGAPRVCAHCSHLVPAMPFCPQCGVADRATARPRRAQWPIGSGADSSPGHGPRELEIRGVADGPVAPLGMPWPTAPPGARPGMRVGFPEARQAAPHGHRVGHAAMIALLVAGLATLTVILVIVAVFAPPPPPPPCPPFGCQSPPVGGRGQATGEGSSPTLPAGPGRVYTNGQGFTVRYFPLVRGTTFYPGVSTDSDSITLTYPFAASFGGDADLTVLGKPDGGSTAQQIVNGEVTQIAPNAQVLYPMTQAYVGYLPGSGEAFETQVTRADGSSVTDELIVMAAVHDGFGIVVVASGVLLNQVTPGSPWWNGHPSSAAISVAYVAENTVTSITFPARRR